MTAETCNVRLFASVAAAPAGKRVVVPRATWRLVNPPSRRGPRGGVSLLLNYPKLRFTKFSPQRVKLIGAALTIVGWSTFAGGGGSLNVVVGAVACTHVNGFDFGFNLSSHSFGGDK